jgi:hypothetical protein
MSTNSQIVAKSNLERCFSMSQFAPPALRLSGSARLSRGSCNTSRIPTLQLVRELADVLRAACRD